MKNFNKDVTKAFASQLTSEINITCYFLLIKCMAGITSPTETNKTHNYI